MRKTVTYTEFQKLNVVNVKDNKYTAERVAEAVKFTEEVSKIWPAELRLTVDQWENEEIEKYSYEHFEVKLITHDANFEFSISYSNREKKYSIFTSATDRVPYMSYESIRWIKEREKERILPEPNRIGVLNAKKIQQWIDYHTSVLVVVLEESAKRAEKVHNFKLSITTNLSAAGLIDWADKDGNQGRAKNGKNLEYSWSISNEGYIDEKIKYAGPNNLDAFLNG